LAQPIVDAWLDRLDAHPELHDKVEFEVASTVLDFAFDVQFPERYPDLLSPDQFSRYRDTLRNLTLACLDLTEAGSLARASRSVSRLDQEECRLPADVGAALRLDQARADLKRCRELGTIPFSVLARHAFIAESLLRSASACGAISQERVRSFKRSVRTVMHDFVARMYEVHAGVASRQAFLERYGHLRPGTYDILSLRYDQRPDLFSEALVPSPPRGREPFEPSAGERAALDALLAEIGSGLGAEGLFEYAARAIAGREYGKFVFTRVLSGVLENLAAWGAELGLDRESLSWLRIEDILTDQGRIQCPARHFADLVEHGRERQRVGSEVKLGSIVRGVRDVYVVPRQRSTPNFVSDRRICGPVSVVDSTTTMDSALAGRIVCIENADPGFDWIFSKNIDGLVTMYGGANSHMAIRSAELGLTAAIGCGEQIYGRVVSAGAVEIDARSKVIRPLGHY